MARPPTRFSFIEVLDILASSPGRLAAAAAGLPDVVLNEPLEPGGWSARDILGHLRACQRTWGTDFDRILDEDQPTYRYQSPRSTIRRTDFLMLPYRVSLDGFTADRARLVARLRSSDEGALERTATVKVSGGRIEQHTAFSYAHRMAEHERDHVDHLEAALSSRR